MPAAAQTTKDQRVAPAPPAIPSLSCHHLSIRPTPHPRHIRAVISPVISPVIIPTWESFPSTNTHLLALRHPTIYISTPSHDCHGRAPHAPPPFPPAPHDMSPHTAPLHLPTRPQPTKQSTHPSTCPPASRAAALMHACLSTPPPSWSVHRISGTHKWNAQVEAVSTLD